MSHQLILADRVVTADGELGDALLIDGERVAAVGQADELRRPDATEIDYRGKVLAPGLRDAHFHPVVYAATLHRLTLKGASDIADVLARVAAAAAALPAGVTLIGSRLDDESLADQRLPTRFDLDRAVPDRPVVLHRYCGHIAVSNTAALEAAGVGPHTPDPPGGSFDRDGRGHPTGVLRETAVATVGQAVGSRTSGLASGQLLEALRGLTKLGLTALGAMVSYDLDPWCGVPAELDALVEVAGDLPLELGVLVIATEPAQLRHAAEVLSGAGPRIRFLGLKGFADGGLGGHTAALREPYADAPGQSGMIRLDRERMLELAGTSIEMGGQVALHAIGDLACERVLDVFEELIAKGADPDHLRVEHASVLSQKDIERFEALNVIASVQPAFLPSETTWLEKRLGPARLRMAYPFATMLEAGIRMAGGSDCPVERPSPFWGVAAARDRAGIVPEECLDARQALRLFTDGAALALREPPPLAPASPATFVALDRDPITSTPDELRLTNVEAVWVRGEPVELPERVPDWPG